MIGRAMLYARTVAHLRPSQWWYLGLRRVQGLPRLRDPRVELAPHADALARAVEAWGEGAEHARAVADAVMAGRFAHLNHAETLPRPDWTRRYASRLWTYHLHYFDFAPELARAFRATGDGAYARRFEALAESWTAAPPGPGWEPYPLSARIVNWTAALLLFGDALRPAAREGIVRSLARQMAVLERRLELHLRANHLLRNYVALAVGGVALEGADAARWRRTGVRGVWRQLDEQVLADGGHVERSPMYLAIVLADALHVLSLCAAAGEPVPSAAREHVRRMLGAMGVLCRPDGRLHLFNDAAQGQAPSRAALDRLARRVVGEGIPSPDGLLALPESGYFGVADAAAGDRFVIDCGPGGPAWQPGHLHCDLLSFELDLDGAPFAADSGLRGYEGDPLREYVRATRAHSTVQIAGREQAEVWGTFRVARLPRVHGAEQGGEPRAYRFRGAYSPYHDPRCRHERAVRRDGREWTITDRVDGAAGAPLVSYLHLHPDWTLEADEGGWTARGGGRRVTVEPFGADAVRVVRGENDPPQGWHSPEFGRALAAPVLEMRVHANDGRAFGYVIRPGGGGAA